MNTDTGEIYNLSSFKDRAKMREAIDRGENVIEIPTGAFAKGPRPTPPKPNPKALKRRRIEEARRKNR